MNRILLVDDEPHVIRVLAQALEREGYEVDSARNGEVALEKILLSPPDVLITDIDMPRMTGEELCKRIAEDLPDRRFYIFVMTSRTELEHREWSKAIGNLDFVEKPISIRRLQNSLYEYFSRDLNVGEESA